jgi:tRNA (guanine10-N2)-dimethyltransferase
MLPPKLAQIIINLANPPAGGAILDPFCGTGVILQEALLMGFKVIGTDIDTRMVDFSQSNIDWLEQQKADLPPAEIFQADAITSKWPKTIDAVTSEVYLGPPSINKHNLAELASDIGVLLTGFLKNIAPQLKAGIKLSLAIPAWRQAGKQSFITPDIGKLTDVGYNHIKFQRAADEELIYWREGQSVGRQLIVLEKV